MTSPIRLLNTTTYKMCHANDKTVPANPKYAILSHRYRKGEIELKGYHPPNVQNAAFSRLPSCEEDQGSLWQGERTRTRLAVDRFLLHQQDQCCGASDLA